jgi:hypothetical protein
MQAVIENFREYAIALPHPQRKSENAKAFTTN